MSGTATDADLILVGGGLANTLIALRLKAKQPQLKLLLLEQDAQPGGNHTWSFHGSDLTGEQMRELDELIQYRWEATQVCFPGLRRVLPGSYCSMTSERLAAVAADRLGDALRTAARVSRVAATQVTLENGDVLTARAVIDGRGPIDSPHLDVRFQKFVGQVVECRTEHGLEQPIIMDATATQDDGYRFFYTLPFDRKTLLIEDTRYSDSPALSASDCGESIANYAGSRGWTIERMVREEAGVLPITLGGDIGAFWSEAPGVPRSGLRAALFHPATGYSLPNAIRLADELSGLKNWTAAQVYACTRAASETLWRDTRFYRVLNRMLFLAADPADRRRVLERFYGLNANLIARFYAGKNTLADKCRVLAGKPPVRLDRAYAAVFNYPQQ